VSTCFISTGAQTGVGWYRVALPAQANGCDFEIRNTLNERMGGSKPAERELSSYALVIWNQPIEEWQLREIRSLKRAGCTVLVDVDDYLPAVRKAIDHANSSLFTKERILTWEKALRECDGITCSTEWLADRLSKFNRTWVCKNGVDLERFDHTYEADDDACVVIGWAGGTGHTRAFHQMSSQAISSILRDFENVEFVSVGQAFHHAFNTPRARSVPFAYDITSYARSMREFDIAIAPALHTDYYRAKSALRYYESAALGVPTVGSAPTYCEINHTRTGYRADTPREFEDALRELIENAKLRKVMGEVARLTAEAEFDMYRRVDAWDAVFGECLAVA
jgi:glycosyltransferase involved in cell wall biosynthesis